MFSKSFKQLLLINVLVVCMPRCVCFNYEYTLKRLIVHTAEVLGRDGLQLFVDAGLPVDGDLVSMLLKEVLLEKLTSLPAEAADKGEDAPCTGHTPAPHPHPADTDQHTTGARLLPQVPLTLLCHSLDLI